MLFAKYSFEEYTDSDSTLVAVCLTQADWNSNPWAVLFFLMTISLFFLLPLLILIVLYAMIAKNLISNENAMLKIRLNKPEVSLKARKQIILMLGAVVFSFFIFLLPFRVFTLWIILVPDENLKRLDANQYFTLLYFCRIMLYLNSAINPILYNLMSSKFRKGFLKIWRCHFFMREEQIQKYRTRTATLNTTTTTTSYLTQSFTSHRKSSEKTVSLEDIKTSVDLVESKLDLYCNGSDEEVKKDITQVQIKYTTLNKFDKRKYSLSSSIDHHCQQQLKFQSQTKVKNHTNLKAQLSYNHDLRKFAIFNMDQQKSCHSDACESLDENQKVSSSQKQKQKSFDENMLQFNSKREKHKIDPNLCVPLLIDKNIVLFEDV
jgi:hypothetical protein